MLAMSFVTRSMEISYVGVVYEFTGGMDLTFRTYNPQE
jgi:hypothetical protein